MTFSCVFIGQLTLGARKKLRRTHTQRIFFERLGEIDEKGEDLAPQGEDLAEQSASRSISLGYFVTTFFHSKNASV